MASVYQREKETVVSTEDESGAHVEVEVTEQQQQTIAGAEEEESDRELDITRNEVLQEIYSNNGSYDDGEKPFSLTRFLGRLSVNLILPFINGLMLGFGEIIAHEIGFHYNWTGARVYPQRRIAEKNSKLL